MKKNLLIIFIILMTLFMLVSCAQKTLVDISEEIYKAYESKGPGVAGEVAQKYYKDVDGWDNMQYYYLNNLQHDLIDLDESLVLEKGYVEDMKRDANIFAVESIRSTFSSYDKSEIEGFEDTKLLENLAEFYYSLAVEGYNYLDSLSDEEKESIKQEFEIELLDDRIEFSNLVQLAFVRYQEILD